MDPKKVIASFFVLALLALAIGFGYMWYQSTQGPDGSFNFDGDRVDSYVTEKGLIIPELDENKTFYRMDITLRNNDFGPGLKTMNLIWYLNVDGSTVNQCDHIDRNKDFKDTTVQKGETVSYVVIFEIPKNTLGEKMSLTYFYASMDGSPKLGYDGDLTPVNVCTSVVDAIRYPA